MHRTGDLLTRWPALDVAARRDRLRGTLRLAPGPLADVLRASADAAARAGDGVWRTDPSTWSADAKVQQTIANRLGWMRSPALMADAIDRISSFAAGVKRDGFSDVVLLGMGGSSLAPEVLRAVLGVTPGWPRFHMLDSTDPAAVRAAATPPDRTVYLLSSKSGTTIEPNSLAAHFRRTLEDARVPRWADHFVAITDANTELAHRARADNFRHVFINPSDIGGRYSVLSFFGLVPAALMGQSVTDLVGWGLAMLCASEPDADAMRHPSVALGLAMAVGARVGRDKLTLVVPPVLEPFGLWVEQLVAESTGKNGVGVVPIAGEPGADATAYGNDRVFVRVRLSGQDSGDAEIARLKSHAPIVEIEMPERSALAAEFLRWEIATAVAGALLGINPFDEPNVQQAKDATRTLLDEYKTSRRLPAPPADRRLDGDVQLTLSRAAREQLRGRNPEAILSLLRGGDYFALLAYLGPDAALARTVQDFRRAVRDRTRVATMVGYGPRYLHSRGQLHKGGPNSGVFVLVSAAPTDDVSIPGEPFSFGTLELAQALGDFVSLDRTQRRVLHVHLPAPDPRLLNRITEALLKEP
ncbi:MAG: glucose-6-phosphate isomerase [Acidobacteria bacterium]|nr:glucose-6-phosphate isomerase [Acidobacteriota bacterium]